MIVFPSKWRYGQLCYCAHGLEVVICWFWETASLCIVAWYTHLILTDRVTTFLTHLDVFLSFPKWL